MNLLEDCGGRICGSDFMFTHALDLIPENLPPLEALARTALADPMVGPTTDRAARIVRECRANRAEAVVVSRIPGASHCAREGEIIREIVRQEIGIPAIELEIPPVCDAMLPTLGSRLQALVETRGPDDKAKGQRPKTETEFGLQPLAFIHDLRRHRRGFALHQGGVVRHRPVAVLRFRPGRPGRGTGTAGGGTFRKDLAGCEPETVADIRRGGHRLRSQCHPFRRHHHHRNHLPCARRPSAGAGRAHDHRNRRAGQQGHQPRRRRAASAILP